MYVKIEFGNKVFSLLFSKTFMHKFEVGMCLTTIQWDISTQLSTQFSTSLKWRFNFINEYATHGISWLTTLSKIEETDIHTLHHKQVISISGRNFSHIVLCSRFYQLLYLDFQIPNGLLLEIWMLDSKHVAVVVEDV